MANSFVGSATGTNTIASMPAHQAGDLLLFFAFRDGNLTAPSLPSGYTNKLTKSDSYVDTSCRVGYKIAAHDHEDSGEWTNATSLICHVYRGVDQTTPLGGSSTYGHNDTGDNTIEYRAVTMTVTDGTSWLAGFVGHAAVNTNIQTAPTGMTNRSNVVDATDEAAGHDTNSGKTSWSRQTVSAGGTDSGWCSVVVEILAGSASTTISTTTKQIQLTSPAGAVNIGKTINAASQDIQLTTPAAQLGIGSGLNATTQQIELAAPASQIDLGVGLNAAIQQLQLSASAQIDTGSGINAAIGQLNTASPSAQIDTGVGINTAIRQLQVDTVTANILLQNDVEINTTIAQITLASPSAQIDVGTAINTAAGAINLDSLVSQLGIGSGINAAIAQIQLTTPAAQTGAEQIINTTSSTIYVDNIAAQIDIGTAIDAAIASMQLNSTTGYIFLGSNPNSSFTLTLKDYANVPLVLQEKSVTLALRDHGATLELLK